MANVSSFSGAMPVIPGGRVENLYVEFTSPVTISGTSSSSTTTIISAQTIVADGVSNYEIEFFAPYVTVPSGAGSYCTVVLQLDGSNAGVFGQPYTGAALGGSIEWPLYGRRVYKFSAGSHTVAVVGYRGTANATVGAQTGSGATYHPGFLRVSKIVNQNDGLKPFWTPPVVTSLPSQATEGDQVLLYSSSPYAGYQTHQYASGSWRTLDDSRGTGAWQSWTPQLVQNGNRTSTTTDSRYIQTGKTVTACAVHTGLQAGSAGNTIRSTLPVTPATQSLAVGSFWYLRSGVAYYVGVTKKLTGSTIEFWTNVTANGGLGADPSFATGTSDQLFYSVTYEAA